MDRFKRFRHLLVFDEDGKGIVVEIEEKGFVFENGDGGIEIANRGIKHFELAVLGFIFFVEGLMKRRFLADTFNENFFLCALTNKIVHEFGSHFH